MSFLAKTGLVLANVKDYGAKGDGVADDTAAIQAAIDDVIATGNLGGIFFPPGNFQVSLTGLEVVSVEGMQITGAGKNISKLQFIAEEHSSIARTLLGLSGGCTDIEISGLDFDGNFANITNPSTGSILIDTGDTNDLEVHNCILQNSRGHAVVAGDDITQASRLAFRDLDLPNNRERCFLFTAVSEVFVERCFSEQEDDGAGFITLANTSAGPLFNDNVFIRDNFYRNIGADLEFIIIEEVSNCEISRNSIRGAIASAGVIAVFVEAGVKGVSDLDIRDNHFVGDFVNVIELTPEDGDIGRFSIVGNECSDDFRLFAGATGTFNNTPNISDNRGNGTGFAIANYPQLPNNCIAVGGQYNDGDGATSSGANQLAGILDPEAAAAIGLLTLTGQPLDTETVVTGAKTYTFQTVLTNVDGNVFIGATVRDSINNLIAAITLGAGSGTLYAAATTANPSLTASTGANDTMIATALLTGVAGDTIATTETLTNGSWGAATLAGGNDGILGSVGDTYQRVDGGAGATFYVKEASAPANEGWVAFGDYALIAAANAWSAAQHVAQVTLAIVGGVVAIDGALSNNFLLDLDENVTTVENPSDVIPGAIINIAIIQDPLGPWTLGWDTAFEFPDSDGTVTPVINAKDMVSCYVVEVDGSDNATLMLCSIAKEHGSPP